MRPQRAAQRQSSGIGGTSGGIPVRPSLRWCQTQQLRLLPSRSSAKPYFAEQRRQQPENFDLHGLSLPSSAESWSDFSVRVALERLYQVNGHLLSMWESSGASSPGPEPALPAYLAVSLEEKPSTYKERSPDFYANVGDAIRTLRDDIPLLFERDLNYEIYTQDVVFKDPRNCFKGMQNYQLIFWSLRFHGRIFFRKLYVEVKRIWQPEDGVIKMRWTVHGIPRVPWEAEGIFDGISQYKLDNKGRILEHSVDNVVLRDPPMQNIPLLAGLNLLPMPAQQPYPGAFCRVMQEPPSKQGAAAASSLVAAPSEGLLTSHWGRLTWVRMYVALLATMQLMSSRCLDAAAMEPALEA